MLEPAEISRRIKAARELRGLDQTELAKLFDADGLNSSDPGRLERGQIAFMPAHRRALALHLRVPERWFTAKDVDEIVGWPDGLPADERLAAIEEQLRLLQAANETRVAELLRRIDERTEPIQASRPRRRA